MWHEHLLWMVSFGFISVLLLLCLFRNQISLRMFGVKSSFEPMTFWWLENGGNISKINETLRSVYYLEGTQSHCWVFEFSNIAKQFYKKQILMNLDENKNTNHNQAMLQRVYYQASLWFSIAKYPHSFNNKSKIGCYKLHKLCYTRAMEMNHRLLEFHQIKIQTHRPNRDYITGYLHKSVVTNVADAAFIIIIGSIDIWKSDLWFLVKQLLEQNISVFTMDLAGTGDNRYKLDQNTKHIYHDAIKWIKANNSLKQYRLNMNNVGVFGVGFGGYFAVELAQHDVARGDKNIQFVITLSAPLIYSFNSKWITSKVPTHLVKAWCFALDIKTPSRHNLAQALATWKLGKYSDESLGNCKMLNIFGANDKCTNPLDGDVFSTQKMVFKNDGYLCKKNIKQWVPKSIEWIKTM